MSEAVEAIVGEIESAVEAACYPKGRSFDPVFIEVTPRQIAEAAWSVIEPHYRHALDAQSVAEVHEREHKDYAQSARNAALEEAAKVAEDFRDEKGERMWCSPSIAARIRSLTTKEGE